MVTIHKQMQLMIQQQKIINDYSLNFELNDDFDFHMMLQLHSIDDHVMYVIQLLRANFEAKLLQMAKPKIDEEFLKINSRDFIKYFQINNTYLQDQNQEIGLKE